MKIFQTLAEVAACVGQEVAVSDWIEVTQERVNRFAEATGDHQWIHVDPERAKAGPFGAPIAHGFLTLSMLPAFFESSFKIEQTRMGVNYGLNKVRFTSPVPVGSRLRARMTLLAAQPIDQGGLQMTWSVACEIARGELGASHWRAITRSARAGRLSGRGLPYLILPRCLGSSQPSKTFLNPLMRVTAALWLWWCEMI